MKKKVAVKKSEREAICNACHRKWVREGRPGRNSGTCPTDGGFYCRIMNSFTVAPIKEKNELEDRKLMEA